MKKTVVLLVVAVLLSSMVLAVNSFVIRSDEEIDVSSPSFLVSFGVKLFKAGYKTEALDMFKMALGSEKVKALNNIGVYFIDQGDSETALQIFEKVLSIDAQSEVALANSALIHNANKDYSLAIVPLRKLVEMFPDNIMYNYDLGVNIGLNFRENEEGDLSEAVEYFRKAESLEPGYEHAKENIEVLTEIIGLMELS